MPNNVLRLKLNHLERKLILFINEHQKLKEVLKMTQGENQALKELVVKKEDQINSFQNKDKISNIVNGMVERSNGKTKEVSDMLNEYITEVDKCIAQLSTQYNQ